MKIYFSIIAVLTLIFSTIPNDSYALSCSRPLLGEAFDESDYVFHGTVSEKNYLTLDSRIPMVTFSIIESFKGNAYDSITVKVNETWDYTFEEGYEYVVFVIRNDLSLEIDPCSLYFHAFPSVVETVRQASQDDFDSDDFQGFFNTLTDSEKVEFEKLNDSIQQKKLERWDSITLQRQILILSFAALVPIFISIGYFVFRRRK